MSTCSARVNERTRYQCKKSCSWRLQAVTCLIWFACGLWPHEIPIKITVHGIEYVCSMGMTSFKDDLTRHDNHDVDDYSISIQLWYMRLLLQLAFVWQIDADNQLTFDLSPSVFRNQRHFSGLISMTSWAACWFFTEVKGQSRNLFLMTDG